MFQTKGVEKIEVHILGSITFFFNSFLLGVNVKKSGRAGQATDYNMAQAHCKLDI
jgi:hypothetical protein